jgi:sterol desaturase/sphingolipid hydroxylase (fatty acid hydroxylase superfamily)
VLLFEIALNATSMFSHANLRLPAGLERLLRAIVVTPDMHRVHHSIVPHETDSNYGFNFSFWDRLFGTYRSVPGGDPVTMPIGLSSYRGVEPTRLPWLLVFPFVKGARA